MAFYTRPNFEDRQVVQYSGTSITLSGETNIGFGGSINIQNGGYFNVQSGGLVNINFTTVLTDLDINYYCDVTSGKKDYYIGCDSLSAVTIYLPTDPQEGRVIWVNDAGTDASINNITIDGGSKNIGNGGVTTIVLTNKDAFINLIFAKDTWRVTSYGVGV